MPQEGILRYFTVCMGILTPMGSGLERILSKVGFRWIRVDSWTPELESANPGAVHHDLPCQSNSRANLLKLC